MKPLGQLLVKGLVAQPAQLGLVLRILGDLYEGSGGKFCRDHHHSGGGDRGPLRQSGAGRRIKLAGYRKAIGFLKPGYRIAG